MAALPEASPPSQPPRSLQRQSEGATPCLDCGSLTPMPLLTTSFWKLGPYLTPFTSVGSQWMVSKRLWGHQPPLGLGRDCRPGKGQFSGGSWHLAPCAAHCPVQPVEHVHWAVPTENKLWDVLPSFIHVMDKSSPLVSLSRCGSALESRTDKAPALVDPEASSGRKTSIK